MSALDAVTFLSGGLMGPKGDPGAAGVPYLFRLRSAIPFFLPAGSASAGFKWTDTTGGCAWTNFLPNSPVHERAWAWFGAGKINGSNAAGWHYMEMTGVQAGRVYANVYSSGDPSLVLPSIGGGTPISGTVIDQWLNSAVAEKVVGPVITVPAGLLPAGALLSTAAYCGNGTTPSATKTYGVELAGLSLGTNNNTTNATGIHCSEVLRAGSGSEAFTTGTHFRHLQPTLMSRFNSVSLDTDIAISLTMQTSSQADSMAINAFEILVMP